MANNLAYYIRLSEADEDTGKEKDESESISNQRALILKYLKEHPEFDDWTIQEFVDDGYTGTNGNRPQFQRMVELVQQRAIQCVIVKDLSRFARNYILLGEYVEQIFPYLGVRFIAINDGYDSKTSTSAAAAAPMATPVPFFAVLTDPLLTARLAAEVLVFSYFPFFAIYVLLLKKATLRVFFIIRQSASIFNRRRKSLQKIEGAAMTDSQVRGMEEQALIPSIRNGSHRSVLPAEYFPFHPGRPGMSPPHFRQAARSSARCSRFAPSGPRVPR